jgi:hypothetical protein
MLKKILGTIAFSLSASSTSMIGYLSYLRFDARDTTAIMDGIPYGETGLWVTFVISTVVLMVVLLGGGERAQSGYGSLKSNELAP